MKAKDSTHKIGKRLIRENQRRELKQLNSIKLGSKAWWNKIRDEQMDDEKGTVEKLSLIVKGVQDCMGLQHREEQLDRVLPNWKYKAYAKGMEWQNLKEILDDESFWKVKCCKAAGLDGCGRDLACTACM